MYYRIDVKIFEYIRIQKYFIFSDLEKLIDCKKDHDCPKTLPKCHKMDRRSSGNGNRKHHNMVKKSYCVFRTCQYCQNKRNCPTLGNVCTSGSLSGKCNADLNTCEYNTFLAITRCPGPGKVKTALVKYV